jgi:hypothetical protein
MANLSNLIQQSLPASGGLYGNGMFFQNGKTVTQNYTVPQDTNAMSAGPVTIDTGVTVTVSSGSRWVVV